MATNPPTDAVGLSADRFSAGLPAVRRINPELLKSLGMNVVKARFDCEASHLTFDLVVKVDEAQMKRVGVNKGATR